MQPSTAGGTSALVRSRTLDSSFEKAIVDRPGRTLGSHTLVLSAGNLLNRALSFLLLPVYWNVLLPAEQSLVILALPAGQVLQRLASQGLGTALFRGYSFSSQSDDERRTLIATTFRYSLLSTIAFFLLGAAIAPLISPWIYENGKGATYLLLAFGYGSVRNVTTLGQQILRARFKTVSLIVLNFVEFLVTLGLNLWLVVFLRTGAIGILISQLAGAAIGMVGTLLFVPETVRGRFSPRILPELLRFGLPMVPGSIALLLMTQIDRYFIDHYGSKADVGIYGTAASFASILEVGLITPFATMWPAIYFPLAKQPDGVARIGRLSTTLIGLALLFTLAAASFCPGVIDWFAPAAAVKPEHARYREAGRLVGLLTLAVVAHSLRELLKIPFNISGRNRWLPPINVLGIGFCVLWNLILVPRHGIGGAAAAGILSGACVSSILWLAGRRLYPLVWPLRPLLLMLLLFVPCFFWSCWRWDQYGWTELALRLLGVLLFAGVLFRTGLLDPELLRWTRKLGSSRPDHA